MPHPFYNTPQWIAIRKFVRKRDKGICQRCGLQGRHVDHIIPRRKAPHLALDPGNLQLLCVNCHNSVKQLEESRGREVPGADASGMPLSPNHPWNNT